MSLDYTDTQLRLHGLGGSDAAAALGLNKYKTPLELYKEKIGESEQEFDFNTLVKFAKGHAVEDIVRKELANELGLNFIDRNQREDKGNFIHQDYPFMRCFIDLMSEDGSYFGEVKYHESKELDPELWGDENSGNIPQIYFIQNVHCCMVTESHLRRFDPDFHIEEYHTHLVHFNGFQNVRKHYVYKRNPDLEKKLPILLGDFWNRIQTKTPPAPVKYEEVSLVYPRSKPVSKVADNRILNMVKELDDIKKTLKELEQKENEFKKEITVFMEEAEVLTTGEGIKIASWKESKPREYLDTKNLKLQEPELIQKFTKVSEQGVRTFRTY
jgi:predicted phage-related endonuclease